jgi:hypothetical protein
MKSPVLTSLDSAFGTFTPMIIATAGQKAIKQLQLRDKICSNN